MRGVVASGHPRVTEAACEVLRSGGNAFDAAVAAGFASTVAEPALTSLGGGGFLLARTADGRETLFDFFVDTPGQGLRAADVKPHFLPVTVRFPGSEQIFNIGLGSAAVPGNLRGFFYVHKRLGRLPMTQVIEPALQLARAGLPLNDKQAYILELLRPIMTLTPAGRTLFEPEGRFLQRGDRFSNSELASFLESLPSTGDCEFYEGGLARRIAGDMRSGQGLITEADLAAYRVIEREPLCVNYRDFCLLTNPLPSFGGLLLGCSLQLLETCSIKGVRFGSSAHLALLVAVMEEVERQRVEFSLSAAWSSQASFAESVARVRTAFGGTTHVSVCDAEGNMASMSCSNGEGSGYLVPGTGVMLNNMMGEDDLHPQGFHASQPGVRVASMMSPSLLLESDRVRLVVGSGGSKRIRTALLQVVSNVADFGMDVLEAVESPRLHWDGSHVQVEPGFEEETLAALSRRWAVNPWPVRDIYFGGVHAVSPEGKGAGDSRRGGHAAVID